MIRFYDPIRETLLMIQGRILILITLGIRKRKDSKKGVNRLEKKRTKAKKKRTKAQKRRKGQKVTINAEKVKKFRLLCELLL